MPLWRRDCSLGSETGWKQQKTVIKAQANQAQLLWSPESQCIPLMPHVAFPLALPLAPAPCLGTSHQRAQVRHCPAGRSRVVSLIVVPHPPWRKAATVTVPLLQPPELRPLHSMMCAVSQGGQCVAFEPSRTGHARGSASTVSSTDLVSTDAASCVLSSHGCP